jgi:hypothetical protein
VSSSKKCADLRPGDSLQVTKSVATVFVTSDAVTVTWDDGTQTTHGPNDGLLDVTSADEEQ